jgi:hypothetical protein
LIDRDDDGPIDDGEGENVCISSAPPEAPNLNRPLRGMSQTGCDRRPSSGLFWAEWN